MSVITLALEAIGLVLGSLVAAILLCATLWCVFRHLGHPDWGPPLVLMLVPIGLLGWLPRSEFVSMTVVFAVIAALPFWAEGRAWRARYAGGPSFGARVARHRS